MPNSEVDDFFLKMKSDLRRPKPSDEAVAAALRALQTLTSDSAEGCAESTGEAAVPEGDEPTELCPKCGGPNSAANRFCGFCGVSLQRVADGTEAAGAANQSPAPAEQHIHHHHHHYFHESTRPGSELAQAGAELLAVPAFRDPEPRTSVEIALRKLLQSWMLACNAQSFDTLASFYAPDALLLRPDLPITRGRGAIRQALETAIKNGLGDVSLHRIDIFVLGETALLNGCVRMLLPVSPGNRQERTGKVLLLTCRDAGMWRIVADVWCIDEPPVACDASVRQQNPGMQNSEKRIQKSKSEWMQA